MPSTSWSLAANQEEVRLRRFNGLGVNGLGKLFDLRIVDFRDLLDLRIVGIVVEGFSAA